MTRPWLICVVFGLCLAVVLAAMGWTSMTVIRLDGAEEQARRQSELEENVRLALWRMDSAIAPLIAQESARPYFSYGAFYPTDRAYTQMFNDVQNGEPLSPLPLLNEVVPHTVLHFQFAPDGKLSSPQVPTGNKVDLAMQMSKNLPTVQASAGRLGEFESQVASKELLRALHEEPVVMQPPPAQAAPQQQAEMDWGTQNAYKQTQRSIIEYKNRAQASQSYAEQGRNWNIDNSANPGNFVAKSARVTEGLVKPVWMGNSLVLARRVVVDGKSYVQGCWLDWDEIRKWQLDNIKDLLPAAELQPLRTSADERGLYRLASLPVNLVPGAITVEPIPFISPVKLSLFVAWICVLLAAVAVAVLLLGAVALSERRGAFVSAVTHELRTPLTTFRMYTEMLAGGMVPQEEKRQQYLNTLRTEAERLSHLVENVLSYARLERTGRSKRMEKINLVQVAAQLKERLSSRAHQAGMELVVGPADATPAFALADPSAVEQILFNLVDNACKYGMTRTMPGDAAISGRIELSARTAKGKGQIVVRDYGQGISKAEARKLFRPFSKSAKDAASTAPGVGLGLALSRRLAREMGGDLYLDHSVPEGACFILSLPS